MNTFSLSPLNGAQASFSAFDAILHTSLGFDANAKLTDIAALNGPWAAAGYLAALQGPNAPLDSALPLSPRERWIGGWAVSPALHASPATSGAAGRAGAGQSLHNKGSTPPPGGSSPPDDEERIVGLWLKELGLASETRVQALSARERLQLARIGSRNRGSAVALVQNRALANLDLPGIRETDQLGLVLTILDRLERMGMTNHGIYFQPEKLLSNKAHELAGVITEISYLAVVAENAGVNGFRTMGSQRSAVPWDALPEGLLRDFAKGWPKLDSSKTARLKSHAEMDGYVVGDRIVEVKLRGRGKVPYSRHDAKDDEIYVNEQLQALKLMAIAKRDGLRGVEFALFAEKVDDEWVDKVRMASERSGVGVRVILYPPAGKPIERLDTMPSMVRRGESIVVIPHPLTPPPAKKRSSSREASWGEAIEGVGFMLSFVGEPKVRAAAGGSPLNFNQKIRPVHARRILEGYRETLEAYFKKRDPKGTNEKVQGSRREWLQRLHALSDQALGGGDRLSSATGVAMALMGAEIQRLVTSHEDALRREDRSRFRFLQAGLPRVSQAFSTLEKTVSRLHQPAYDYTMAPTMLSQLDELREAVIHAELKEILKTEGLAAMEELSLQELSEEVGKWRSKRGLTEDVQTFLQELQRFAELWRSTIDRHLPEAMARWHDELVIMEEMAPPTEPFPKEIAREFLARFKAMSSGGADHGKKRGPLPVQAGDWKEAVSLLGLDGSGLNPPLGTEVAAAIALLPSNVRLLPAEIARIRYALDGIDLYHVTEKEADTFYYLPHVYTAAVRMIRTVLLTALLRQRSGTTLGLGRQLIFPWVIGMGQRGQQPYWIEVEPGGRADQLVLGRIVVAGESQIPRTAEELMRTGLTLALPREGGGSRMVHFDLVPPVARHVPVDPFTRPTEMNIDALIDELVQASFRDRHPEGRHIDGGGRFRPIEAGYFTVPEIDQMHLQDAYLRRRAKGADNDEPHQAALRDQRYFTASRLRRWPEFIEHYLDMQRTAGRSDLPPPSRYVLRVRTSHRGPTHLLLHLERITNDFGEHLRLKRIPGFDLATEIAASGRRDAWGIPWTHSRLVDLFTDIEQKVPEADRNRFIRRPRSTGGGTRYSSLEPGQVALNLRDLKRSPWGDYFRTHRPVGFLRRRDLLNRGMSERSVGLITEFIDRHVPAEHRKSFVRRIRGNGSPYEVIFNLQGLLGSYADRLPMDLQGAIRSVLPRKPPAKRHEPPVDYLLSRR